ncbi:MAG: hypothetical protein HYV63_08055 [Candidatus Schekmanbacteria bacterium]|nr:hypothetical protein [Candidatus Schekmanbacteria bacterium]
MYFARGTTAGRDCFLNPPLVRRRGDSAPLRPAPRRLADLAADRLGEEPDELAGEAWLRLLQVLEQV